MNEVIVLRDELHYAISLHEILWGGVLLAITVVIHGSGMVLTLRASEALKQRVARLQSHFFILGLSILVVAAWMIIVVDLLEVAVWAGFYVWKGAMANPSRAFYFALVNYCTLNSGYLPLSWRLLEGMLGMAGLLTFAWSTGIMFTLAQEFQQKVLRRTDRSWEKSQSGPASPPHHVSGDSDRP